MTGTNARPLGETIAGTGPGIADDALGPGEEMPTAPSDAEVGAVARRLGADVAEAHAAPADIADTVAMNPGDEARPGTVGTGDDVCRTCNGSGRVGGDDCPTCGGTGLVTEAIGGG